MWRWDNNYVTINPFKKDKVLKELLRVWRSTGVTEAVGTAESSGVLGTGATDFLLYAGRSAVNPQLEVLFKGTDMRSLQFIFKFAPFSVEEAKNVIEIIRTFKFHRAA
jgi:hypothetical protein